MVFSSCQLLAVSHIQIRNLLDTARNAIHQGLQPRWLLSWIRTRTAPGKRPQLGTNHIIQDSSRRGVANSIESKAELNNNGPQTRKSHHIDSPGKLLQVVLASFSWSQVKDSTNCVWWIPVTSAVHHSGGAASSQTTSSLRKASLFPGFAGLCRGCSVAIAGEPGPSAIKN